MEGEEQGEIARAIDEPSDRILDPPRHGQHLESVGAATWPDGRREQREIVGNPEGTNLLEAGLAPAGIASLSQAHRKLPSSSETVPTTYRSATT